MNPELTVVANAGMARLFSRDSRRDPLTPLAVLHHPQSRNHGDPDGTAPAGHGNNDWRPGGIAFQPRTDRKRKEHLRFADEISRRIDEELEGGRHRTVLLFASCPFIGELKSRLSAQARRSLQAVVESDLTSFGLDELQSRVDEALTKPLAREDPRF